MTDFFVSLFKNSGKRTTVEFFNIIVYQFKFIFFFALMVLVSFIDIDYHAIPVYLCVTGIIFGLIFNYYHGVIIRMFCN